MTTLTATEARRDFFDLVKSVNEQHTVHHIHHRKGDVVMLSQENYDSLVETLELLSIPGFKESIQTSVKEAKRGETYSFDEVFGLSK